ncbi:MAG TPA: ubiquinol-cytochrome c reductase iron-sulfur subunit [Rhizomicrobium sp.]|nr:ubiquinol-cytochrome c reductase iron-sulfur subunit [Rhizomicrobium sp.]
MAIACDPGEHGVGGVPRRDFLYIATGAFAAVGVALAAWPLVDQMNPSSSVRAGGAPLSVDLSSLAPGQQITVMWRAKPVFIVHRTPAILQGLKSPALLNRLRDPDSQERQQPSYAANWSRALHPDYLVLVGICTHLGCIPKFHPDPGDPALGPAWPGGWLCPCHGSLYDLAGRVFRGVPAPLNLPVPPYRFANATTLVIGANPPGSSYDLASVEQL